ncbi:MAG: Ig-like domain repeat protein [Bacteroidetes bacterium]|nr:Ig-like domain repeat protein [Bacteroidota bacterium]
MSSNSKRHALIFLSAGITGLLCLVLLVSCKKKEDDTPAPAAPTLVLLVPSAGTLSYAAEQTLRVVVQADAEGEVASIGYRIEPVSAGIWQYSSTRNFGRNAVRDTADIYLPTSAPAGEYRLRVTLTDKAGQTAEVTREFTFTNPNDLAAPAITIISPDPDQVLHTTAGSTLRLQASFRDDQALDILQVRLFTEDNLISNLLYTTELSGTQDAIDETVTLPNVLPANYNLTFLVSDEALNVTTATVKVVITP